MSGTKRRALVQMPKDGEASWFEDYELGPEDLPEDIEKRVIFKAKTCKEDTASLSQDSSDPAPQRKEFTPVKPSQDIYTPSQKKLFSCTPEASAPKTPSRIASQENKPLFGSLPVPLVESKTMKALLADLQNEPRVASSPAFSKYFKVDKSPTPTKVLPQSTEYEKVFCEDGYMHFGTGDRGYGKIEVLDGSKESRVVVFLVFRIPSGRIIFQGKVVEDTAFSKADTQTIESNEEGLPEFTVTGLLTSDGEMSCRLALEESLALKLASLVFG